MKIIDVSHYDSAQDISPYDGVIIKATQGGGVIDPMRDTWVKRCKTLGKPYGFYHYFDFQTDVQKQVDNFNKSLAMYPGATLHPAVDVELDNLYNKTTAGLVDKLTPMLAGIHNVMLYANTSLLKTISPAFQKYPIWQAEYNKTQTPLPGYNVIGWQYQENPDISTFSTELLTDGGNTTTPKTDPPISGDFVGSSDVYIVSSLPCNPNARAGDFFYVRNADGTRCVTHMVNNGDEIIILGVLYDRQLAEILYPIPGHWVHGYIANAQNSIHDLFHFQWQNGSTAEAVFADDGHTNIGTIFAREFATPLYRHSSGMLKVLYNTDKGMETKSGLVRFNGGFTKF